MKQALISLTLFSTLALAPAALQSSDAIEAGAGDGVAARVNGVAIDERAIDEMIANVISQQMQGRPVPPEQMQMIRQSLLPQVLERLIDDELLNQEAGKRKLVVTDDDLLAEMQTELSNYTLSTGLPKVFMQERIAQGEGMSFNEFVRKRALEPTYRAHVLQRRVLHAMRPEETRVTDEEIAAEYTANAERFKFPPLVRASHILIGTEGVPEDQRAESRAKAVTVRDLARAADADFAALAKEHSTGPSGPLGGDLGYFPKEQMVGPFAEAAFAMKTGEVSDLVETQFGYHIILVADRREGHTLSLADATGLLRAGIESGKLEQARVGVVADLRAGAKIEYTNQG